MPTREEKLAFIQEQLKAKGVDPAQVVAKAKVTEQAASAPKKPLTREEKLDFIKKKLESPEMKSAGLAQTVLDGLQWTGEKADAYGGGASMRAGMMAALDGKNPLPAMADQYGDSKTAPTGKQIAQKAGIDDKPVVSQAEYDDMMVSDPLMARDSLWMKNAGVTHSGLAGTVIDVATPDLTSVAIPALKVGIKAVEKLPVVARAAGQAIKPAAKAVPGVQAAANTIDAVKDGAKNTSEALKKMFQPRQADDWRRLADIADKNEIPRELLPEAVEFGEDSFIARAARNRAEGVLGEEHLKRFHKGLEAVQGATEKKIAQIAGGTVPDAVEAGEIIRAGFDEGIAKFFDDIQVTHSSIQDAFPGMPLHPKAIEKIESKLNGIEKWAKGQAKRGFTQTERTQAEQVLRAIEAVREGNGSYKQTYETLSQIGKTAFSKNPNRYSDIAPDVKKFQDLYFTINDALIDTVRAAEGLPAWAQKKGAVSIADELVENNKKISEMLSDKAQLGAIIGNRNLAPEKVFQTLIANGDTTRLQALKKILPPEKFKQLKGAFLANLIKRQEDGSFTFRSFHNNLRSKKNVIGEILDADEISELSDLIELGDRFGSPVLSTSGTGGSRLFSNIKQGILSGVESDTTIDLLKQSARNRSAKQVTEKAPEVIALSPKAGPSRLQQYTGRAKELSEKVDGASKLAPTGTRAFIHGTKKEQEPPEANRKLKGNEKWANDGLNKAIEAQPSLQKQKGALLSNPKAKRLLIELSDLKPGSRAFASTMKRLSEVKA